MSTPFFSIITPVFNGNNFIDDYIYSLLSQTFEDWEAIIVDDNSTDCSEAKVHSATKRDPRFNLFSSNNFLRSSSFKGPYHPRNIALSIAKGKYICFLDIDDYWLPDKLYWQYQAIISNPTLSVLISSFYKADSRLVKGYLKPFITSIPIQTQILFWNPVPMLTACVEIEIIKNISFPPMHHEDFVFWYEVFSAYPKCQISICPHPLAIYRSSVNSVSSNKIKVLKWWLLCFKRFGYPFHVSLIFLFVKLVAQLVEYLLVVLRIIPTKNLSFLLDKPLSSID